MNELSAIGEVIAGEWGINFLYHMRNVYLGYSAVELGTDEDSGIMEEGTRLGLFVPGGNGEGRSLSGLGYLVGNIAKEYCNWLD
jgi:hypothetical protein